MPFLFILGMIILEIYTFAKVWTAFGFVNTMFALLVSAVLGIGIAKNQGKYLISQLQISVSRGQIPPNNVLHGLLIFLGGILLAIPGFVSDIIGILFILPGTRHLIVAFVKFQVQAKLIGKAFGAFKIFTSGMGGANQTSHSHEPGAPAEGWERDVSPKVIDIKPVSTQTNKKED